MKEKIYSFAVWHMFVFWSLFYVMLALVMNSFVLTDTWFYNILSGQLTQERIADLLQVQKKFTWLSYLFIPIVLFLKWFILAGVLYVALFLANTNLKFFNVLKIIIIAEFSLAIATGTKTLMLLIHKPESLLQLQFFYPLSLAQFANVSRTPIYLSYALQQINVFEIAYWLLLMLGVTTFTEKKVAASFKLVAASYGIAFCCWILFVTFIQLQLS